MPTVRFAGQQIHCEAGANLRRVLLDAKLPLYNRPMRALNCRGFGTCGTCAVQVEGDVSAATAVERWRLGFKPHRQGSGLRLACQCEVLGDLDVTKYPGGWGQDVEAAPVHDPAG